MNSERTIFALARLSHLVQQIQTAEIKNLKDYERWATANEREIADRLGYIQKTGMPPAHLLVKPFFHPVLPLIGLNYNHNAQRMLQGHPEGWTDALRYCRGNIFERPTGNLIALSYFKFFNLFNHEHPEADNPPDGPFEATVKLDGHLGIVFNYADRWHLTTHGSFKSYGTKLGQEMLDKHIARHKSEEWADPCHHNLTLRVEIIHPSTRIRCDYHGHQGLVLTGIGHRGTLQDYGYNEVARFGQNIFGLHVTDMWRDFTLDELRREVAEEKPKDREGFVLRFADGTYGKLKYKHYLDRMSDQNLSYNGLMRATMDGTLKTKLANIAEELWPYADDMLKKLEKARQITDPKKAREYIYGLVPPEKSTQHYRSLCREYLAFTS